MDADLVEVHDVEVVGDTGLTLVCSIAGRRVLVPTLQIHPRSTARRPGDRGTLVLPRWLAQNLGLA
jgi:hypothetical protein